ncbi:unnamed protein product [Ilex paraguariensis]|uniref:Uncharacterized protein n=1 Tax=Ilex paraguariensis TaxID=185542 RepID=A0ABC8TCP3_9AQUA
MDACIAFSFVLNAETTQKYVGPRRLAEKTQIISSLLGNLLDVVVEVQLAQIELQNLTQTSFLCPRADQLDLQLSFLDFKSGRKAILTLDISCLNRGVYPSEILPSQLAAPFDGSPNSSSQPLIAEIGVALQTLRAGYLRILRLCRCVSQVVQSFEWVKTC